MLAIIPARGGSKGLPGKNIKPLLGKPLIAYAVEAALASKYIDRVIVTTDDEEIARVAREAGAEVPFMRPAELASDTATAVDVYIHATEFMMKETGEPIEKFMVLLPTAPLRTVAHIDGAVEAFKAQGSDTLISVTEAETPPSWYMNMDDRGCIANAGFGMKGAIVNNRQVNDAYYIPNGAIYILDYKLLKEKRTYYSDNTYGYVMGRLESIDIDNIDDFEYAEFLMKKAQGN
ncbi:N-acylneuraminate cytidylyltransferase [Pseudobutyrivibrio sp. YE44]|uniref:acylneuraminate cytidylyltransferase family protein n=1 Tax=Pseudobutyrivibrio sp. YE44 TaxID=1520802 RepID=UPI0008906D21|nr:acylneuraminate cytidylyltransferase family protein [Pseudobutyrivibrio sp. YE44]SDB56074.1 N-acylneuraminate cytidylyltransferase [Pseudobutyrivibrio sp. YE44]